MKRRNDPNQLSIDWANPHPPAGRLGSVAHPVLDTTEQNAIQPAPLVQRLKWDFTTSFPQPSDAAIDAGILDESDREPANVRALHEEHAREALVVLWSIDKVLDARRRGVDPKTGRPPAAKEDRDGLQDFLTYELEHCQRWWQTLMDTYEEAFGAEATDAFGKAIRARHAGIEVTADKESPARPSAVSPADKPAVRKARAARISSRLPVPGPLRSSVAAGIFGSDEDGKPIRPAADEVREITEDHAEKMLGMDEANVQSAVAKYAEDFGPHAAAQLERYVWRQKRSR